MVRTPYDVSPYGVDRYRKALGSSEAMEKEGFFFVFQDVRGKHMSEGEYVDVRPETFGKHGADGKGTDESTDAYDTIAWLLAHVPNSNGNVGQWGISYPGFYASTGAIDSHPALKATSPQAPVSEWFKGDDMHRNGAFNLQGTFYFFDITGRPRPTPTDDEEWSKARFKYGTPDAYQFYLDLGPLSEVDAKYFKGEVQFWKDCVAHPNYDAFWKARNVLPQLRNIKAAVMVVGGWYDTEDLYGTLGTYHAIEEQNPGITNTLVMGPWRHGGWNHTPGEKLGDADFGWATSEAYRESELAFFKHYLKGGPDPKLPEAMVFETGANRWRQFTSWPPPGVHTERLYFREGGGLTKDAPIDDSKDKTFDEYPSDPARPVPYTVEIAERQSANYMAEDQRFASRRPDVLVYRTPPLEHDVTIAGPIDAELFVSTTGTDADFVVKLIDVNPGRMPGWTDEDDRSGKKDRGGQETLVRGEPFRGRFRDSFETPKAFVPGEIAKIKYRIDDVFHTFQRGHRIMIQVQSSWFPFIDRNPQTFVPSIFEAKASDFVKANHRIHRSKSAPSSLEIRVLPRPDE
jgi:putative CocE/NonD family hydrolase